MMNGLLLALQFFTIFPVKKELPLGRKEVTMMYVMLPVIGLLIGITMYVVYILSMGTLGFSALLTATLLIATGFILTGGLHLDGWADTADAFFSYQEPEKRFDILEDPRLGAFGTMALMLLVLTKLALVYEALTQKIEIVYAVIFIPFIARALLTICFATLPAGKKSGIAAFFKERLAMKVVIASSSTMLVGILILYAIVFGHWVSSALLLGILILSIFYFRHWTKRNFYGITGDLAGAYIEGMEVILWLAALFLL